MPQQNSRAAVDKNNEDDDEREVARITNVLVSAIFDAFQFWPETDRTQIADRLREVVRLSERAGWRFVPLRPTEAMGWIGASDIDWNNLPETREDRQRVMANVWESMARAAPSLLPSSRPQQP